MCSSFQGGYLEDSSFNKQVLVGGEGREKKGGVDSLGKDVPSNGGWGDGISATGVLQLGAAGQTGLEDSDKQPIALLQNSKGQIFLAQGLLG